jgi:hypothetical protein
MGSSHNRLKRPDLELCVIAQLMPLDYHPTCHCEAIRTPAPWQYGHGSAWGL